jgi:hypothetical protein
MTNAVKPKSLIHSVISRLFCTHDYNLVNQYELESEFDIVVKAGKVPNTWNCQKRRLITDYKCSKCGKIKRLTATTPN